MNEKIHRIEEIEAYADENNPWLKVYFDRVKFPDGRIGRYNRVVEVGGHPGVAVLPLRTASIGLVRQYRYPIDKEVWEIPRGYSESLNTEANARRELAEETGLVALKLVSLGVIYPNSGILASEVRLFAAEAAQSSKDMVRTGDEVSEFRWFPLTDVLARIDLGEINDAFTLAAILRAQQRGLLAFR
ncbi:MAG: NUDIX hydrolase [Planctomycetes bacterium]|nr:NUDIX hydrolase [Planctomycetota bacterium]MBI3833269.1 NUDIX hydrolase [Planctomycetota bacterium]